MMTFSSRRCSHYVAIDVKMLRFLRRESNLRLLQLSENWTLLTVLPHIQSMFIDRDKINMQLSYTLAFE